MARRTPQPTAEALYGLRPAVVHAVTEAAEAGDGKRVRRLIYPLHHSDVADLLERLKPDDRHTVIEMTRRTLAPEVLTELDDTIRDEVIDVLEPQQLAAAVTGLETDDAVEIIEDLDVEVQQEILEAVPEEDRALIEEGLSYPEESAGRLMQRETVAVPTSWTVGETIDHMRESDDLPDEFFDIFVVDRQGRLVGTVPLNTLLRTRRPVRVKQIMSEDITKIPLTMDQEDVALLFRDRDLISAPVLDAEDRLVGMITVDDVVDVIDEEAEEDIMRLAGVRETDVFRAVLETARARFPWLAINIFTAVLASVVIGLFEASIQQVVALAILMPIVASLGGNAGTQTLTVAVRALAMRELSPQNTMRYFGKELMVNFINGCLLAIPIGIAAAVWFGRVDLGLVIGAAMIVNLVVAGLGGTLVPLSLEKVGVDPAIASSVFVTTLTDVIGFLAFLGFATLFLL